MLHATEEVAAATPAPLSKLPALLTSWTAYCQPARAAQQFDGTGKRSLAKSRRGGGARLLSSWLWNPRRNMLPTKHSSTTSRLPVARDLRSPRPPSSASARGRGSVLTSPSSITTPRIVLVHRSTCLKYVHVSPRTSYVSLVSLGPCRRSAAALRDASSAWGRRRSSSSGICTPSAGNTRRRARSSGRRRCSPVRRCCCGTGIDSKFRAWWRRWSPRATSPWRCPSRGPQA